ncbi:MAG: TonB-dependent receptor [Methylococcaceae bacterium]|nr:TonB-dependent receptor [Methylococcaceae bacterium]
MSDFSNSIPQTYVAWRHCITVDCGIPLTFDFVNARIAVLTYEKNDFSTNARLTRGEAQTNPGENETSTPSYLLLNLGAQYRISRLGDADILLFANGKNMLNENIRNATSYLRNFAPNPGRSAEVGIRMSY